MTDDYNDEWYCDECDQQFADKDDFNSHLRVIPGYDTNPPEEECIRDPSDREIYEELWPSRYGKEE